MSRLSPGSAAIFALALLTSASVLRAGSSSAPTTQPQVQTAAGNPNDSLSVSDIDNLSLEQLLNVPVQTPAGLTATDQRELPVDVTQLDVRDIQDSGVRDLNHLMEDYVPNAQLINHHSPESDLGFRGIISDREDKYLYQVNGITLNNRLLYGANDERDLPLLGDFKSVDVVRGPASATYGSGAIAGVIDAQTYNGLTFQGADATVRESVVDQYTAGELRYGKALSPTSGVFLYYGAADVMGADSHYYIAKSYPAANGLPANTAGQPADVPRANLGQAAFDAPWQKGYASYVDGPFEVWFRYVQDGTQTLPRRDIYTDTKPADLTVDEWTHGRAIEDQQFTTTTSYKKDLSPTFNVELSQAFDFWLARDQREGVTLNVPIRNSYEDQLFDRAIARWNPVESNSLAFGGEYSHIWYHDPPQSDALDRAPVVTTRYWEVDTFSPLVEDQWKINKQLTSFLSFRADKNTYTPWLYSPRATLVYEPSDADTFKIIIGRSVRRADDEDIWGQWERTHTFAKPETLTTYEVAYERKLNNALTFNTDGFYENYSAIGWDPSAQSASSLGRFQIAGAEAILTYKSNQTRVTLSEGYSTLVLGQVPPGSPPAAEGISSAPYGFGNQLAAWAPSITKLTLEHDITSHLTVSSSAVFYSGFPGAKDYANYAATLASPPSAVPLSDPGNNAPYGPNLYLNAGLGYRFSDHLAVRFDAYNLADLWDEKLSKRNFILRESEFAVEPAEFAVSVHYSF